MKSLLILALILSAFSLHAQDEFETYDPSYDNQSLNFEEGSIQSELAPLSSEEMDFQSDIEREEYYAPAEDWQLEDEVIPAEEIQ